MNLQFDIKLQMNLPIDTLEYSTIRIQKALLPMSWYNVSGDLHNNYLKYVKILNGAIVGNGSLIVKDGLYSPMSYNDAIQELKKKNLEGNVQIEYNKERGRIKMILKNEDTFALVLHNTLCEFLGLKCDGGYTRKTITGIKAPNFLRHRKYKIECNLVDSEINLINGERSEEIDYFLPIGRYYGDSIEYIPINEKRVRIRKYNHSDLRIKILNHLNEEVRFDSEFCVSLILE